jgi:hypothetical protein
MQTKITNILLGTIAALLLFGILTYIGLELFPKYAIYSAHRPYGKGTPSQQALSQNGWQFLHAEYRVGDPEGIDIFWCKKYVWVKPEPPPEAAR